VLAEVVDHPSTKLYVQHFRRRKNYRRLRGHRQPYTAVQVRSILLKGMEPPPEPASPAPSPEAAQTGSASASTEASPGTPPKAGGEPRAS
jgi:hypothetical protein